MPDLHTRLGQLSALAEPVRRDLYTFVVARREPVTREQAAAGLDVPVHVAKFHLDRLVEDGLLDAEYRRPPGRGGPGAGRPAQVYCRAQLDLEISLPPRRYDLAGRLLARGVARAQRTDSPIAETLDGVAREAGHELASRAVATARRRSQRQITESVVAALTHDGFEPIADRDSITLTN